ncbi:hypothetical protein [Rhodococcus sp. 14-2496-1d]|uniref:hypothetical protein n=1 Tax=Rhodococcus sp. 14-2496-1d TaxID=2023146 RepID=UPI00117A64B2|nr:hypothetical protein [Rhodococcus sp. 14-2496-1d]
MIEHTRPDFVMVGVSTDDGVMLLASNELTEAELDVERDIVRDFLGSRQTVVNERYTLSAEMRRYVTIVAPTYADAFATLFKTWTPERGGQRGISAGQSLAAADGQPYALPSGA